MMSIKDFADISTSTLYADYSLKIINLRKTKYKLWIVNCFVKKIFLGGGNVRK